VLIGEGGITGGTTILEVDGSRTTKQEGTATELDDSNKKDLAKSCCTPPKTGQKEATMFRDPTRSVLLLKAWMVFL